MKFFKYLIFPILSFLSINAFADYQLTDYQGLGTFSSKQEACNALKASYGSSFSAVVESDQCVIYTSSGSRFTSTYFIEVASQCSPQSIKSKPIAVPGWTSWTLDQTDAYTAKIKGQTACYNGCKYKDPIIAGDSEDQFKISFANPVKDSSCPATSDLPNTPYPDNVTPPTDGCKNGEAYCSKPPTGCPSGYTSGSYNGKDICVKNNPDPTKPNPNDPNNNPNNGGGKFDDSKIIAAINDSKTSITNSINNAVNSINSSISTINQSITAVANAVTGTTNAVNSNTNAVNAVKSSVDALHNTINAVTTAVNNNTTSVTNAVNTNTSATNAVKASVDALNSTVSAVTSAVDNNTKAVNANADKVANAVKDNTTATNAVKTAVESLNSSVNAVTTAVNANGDKVANETKASGDKVTNAVNSVKTAVENLNNAVNASGDKVSNAVNATGDKITNAINANGKNTVDATNAGTEATNENGKKLDKIDKNGKDLNDFVMGCKTDSSGNKTCSDPFDGQEQEDGKVDILENEIDNKFDGSILDASASCPPPMQISFTLFQTHTLTYSYETMCNIASYIRPIVIFIGMFIAFMIVTGQRSSNDA